MSHRFSCQLMNKISLFQYVPDIAFRFFFEKWSGKEIKRIKWSVTRNSIYREKNFTERFADVSWVSLCAKYVSMAMSVTVIYYHFEFWRRLQLQASTTTQRNMPWILESCRYIGYSYSTYKLWAWWILWSTSNPIVW